MHGQKKRKKEAAKQGDNDDNNKAQMLISSSILLLKLLLFLLNSISSFLFIFLSGLTIYLFLLSRIVLYFHHRPAIPQPHEPSYSDTTTVFGFPLRLGHEKEAEWSLGERGKEGKKGREDMRERMRCRTVTR